MTLIKLILLGFVFIASTVNVSYGNSVIKKINHVEIAPGINALKYVTVRDFIKLSPKKFSAITGQKMNVLNTFSFYMVKMKVKHDYKRNHDLQLADYFYRSKVHIGKGGLIALGIFAVIIILGLAGALRLD